MSDPGLPDLPDPDDLPPGGDPGLVPDSDVPAEDIPTQDTPTVN